MDMCALATCLRSCQTIVTQLTLVLDYMLDLHVDNVPQKFEDYGHSELVVSRALDDLYREFAPIFKQTVASPLKDAGLEHADHASVAWLVLFQHLRRLFRRKIVLFGADTPLPSVPSRENARLDVVDDHDLNLCTYLAGWLLRHVWDTATNQMAPGSNKRTVWTAWVRAHLLSRAEALDDNMYSP